MMTVALVVSLLAAATFLLATIAPPARRRPAAPTTWVATVGGLRVGEHGWAPPRTASYGLDGRLWVRTGAPVRPLPTGEESLYVERRRDGYWIDGAVDLTRLVTLSDWLRGAAVLARQL